MRLPLWVSVLGLLHDSSMYLYTVEDVGSRMNPSTTTDQGGQMYKLHPDHDASCLNMTMTDGSDNDVHRTRKSSEMETNLLKHDIF